MTTPNIEELIVRLQNYDGAHDHDCVNDAAIVLQDLVERSKVLVSDLILKLRGQAYTTCRPDQLCDQAADLLQSQAERIAELEDRITELTSEENSIPELRQMLDDSYAEKQKCYFALSQHQLAHTNLLTERDTLRAELAELAATEPSMIYHGRCVIDCGDSGHHDVTMLKMIARETKLFTRPVPAQNVNAEFVRVIQFAISQDSSASDFLNGWLHGDTDEWPEFTNAKGAK